MSVRKSLVKRHAERTGNPWLDNFGRFKDDPTFDDFLAEMEAYRRELDADEVAGFAVHPVTAPSDADETR